MFHRYTLHIFSSVHFICCIWTASRFGRNMINKGSMKGNAFLNTVSNPYLTPMREYPCRVSIYLLSCFISAITKFTLREGKKTTNLRNYIMRRYIWLECSVNPIHGMTFLSHFGALEAAIYHDKNLHISGSEVHVFCWCLFVNLPSINPNQ